MRRAVWSTCVQSYGACAQACTQLNSIQQGYTAPGYAAHTRASGLNPGRHSTAHTTAEQADNASPKPSSGKKLARWRIVHLPDSNWRMQDSTDLRNVNDSDGKLENFSSFQSMPALASKPWPAMRVSSHANEDEDFSKPLAGTHARIVLASYRASAEMFLSEWRNVITESFQEHSDVELVELHVCDLAICKVWPFKSMLLNSTKSYNQSHTALSKMSARRVHFFGDEKVAADQLGMSNRLTGYVFLVDEGGCVRWQASGKLLEEEAHSFLKAVRSLLGAHKRKSGRDDDFDDSDSFSC